MISLLPLLAVSYDPTCVAEHTTPEPVQGMTPVYLQVLLRHGSRTPMNAWLPATHRGYWICDGDDAIAPRMFATPIGAYRRIKHVTDPRMTAYRPNCREGDLLVEGMKQHQALGEAYNKYVFEKLKLIDPELNTSQIHVRATDIERTFRSAQSFLHGFYPPDEPNQIIHITRGHPSKEIMRPSADFCAEIGTIIQERNADPEFHKYYEENWEKISSIAEQLNVSKTESNLNLVCDWISTHYCDDKRISIDVSDDIQQMCLKLVADYHYGAYQRKPFVAGSYLMREILRVANMSLSGKSPVKFTLNSAHDSSICTIIALLSSERTERVPPYASHLTMEIWKDASSVNWVRFALNGKLITLREMENKTLVKYDDFLSAYAEIHSHCTELP